MFNWLLCIVFPQGTREQMTITTEEAREFYQQHFFPEAILRHGKLLSSKTSAAEKRAFMSAFEELPGPSADEKRYEGRISGTGLS